MRILRLDLLAFGPFTGKSLQFDDAHHGLHIVYGLNEAGKSSSLRALRQLLYGIPHKSSDTFLHSYENLRIGGTLESADGSRLEFVRRKGRTNTLRGPDDVATLDPALLSAMLSHIDETTFCQRFGIDYPELRKGGEAVVQGQGDLGEILFAAGAGVADLGLVQKRLDEDSDKLFKARGSVQRINQAISELADVRRVIKDAQLPTSDWVSHDKALRLAEKRHSDIDEQLAERRSQASQWERVLKALPLIGRRRRLLAQRTDVVDAPQLPDEFSGNRREAIAELSSAEQTEQESSREIETLQAAMAGLHVPEGLLEHRTAITRLHTDLGSFQKAAKDRPGLVGRWENAEQRAKSILRDLGRDPELQDAERLRLSRTHRQRIQALAADCHVRLEKKSSADRAVQRLRVETQRAESQLETLASTPDASPLQQVIRRAQRAGDLDRQLAEARHALRRLESQAEIDLRKLRLWSGTLEQLEALAVPTLATLERFENDLAVAEARFTGSEERLKELNRQIHNIEQQLEKLRLEQDVPTEADLSAARHLRDEGWQLVRQSWASGRPADAGAARKFIGECAPDGDLQQAFQASVAAADIVADRLRREADRVAEKAKLATDRQDLDRQRNEQQLRLADSREALDQLRSEWRDQWTSLAIEPLSPREMRSWLNQQQELMRAAETVRQRRATTEATETQLLSLRSELIQCLRQLDKPCPNPEDTLSATLEQCDALVHEIESAKQKRQAIEEHRQRLRGDLSDAEEVATQAQRDLEEWRTDWAEAVAALGLDRDAAPAEANSVIELVDELLGLLKDAGDVRSRIEGIDREAEDFQQSVGRLLRQVAEDLRDLPVDQAVADLYDRLQAASSAQTRLDGWRTQLQAEASKRDKARSNVERIRQTIAVMCHQAGCASPDDLPAAERNSALRRDIEKELQTIHEQLEDLAGGGSLPEWIAAAESVDADQLRADLQGSYEEMTQWEEEKRLVSETIGSHRNELRRMDGSGRAAEGQAQAEHLLARIRNDAEQYIRLRLASMVLRRAIERFRDASQGPVLARASELFAELTLRSFAGLRADFDDQGKAVLVGVRAGNGQPVGVTGMSEGTCDQLYLSLRLALLEASLQDHEPVPFIIDDILIMFDDERAVAALRVLARLSERTQVIFFTHHEHLVRLARQHLDPSVLFTHTLEQRSLAESAADSAVAVGSSTDVEPGSVESLD